MNDTREPNEAMDEVLRTAQAVVGIQNYIDEVHRRGHGFDGLRASEVDRANAIKALREALANAKDGA